MKDFNSLGMRSCRRGGLPYTFRNALQSLTSRFRASSKSAFRKRKWGTFMSLFRFLWSRNLDRIEVSLLPIYTTVSVLAYPNSYAPGSSSFKQEKGQVRFSYKNRHILDYSDTLLVLTNHFTMYNNYITPKNHSFLRPETTFC